MNETDPDCQIIVAARTLSLDRGKSPDAISNAGRHDIWPHGISVWRLVLAEVQVCDWKREPAGHELDD